MSLSRILLVAVALLLPATSQGAVPSITITTPGGGASAGSLTVGHDFEVKTPVLLRELGFFDSNIDGLLDAHQVGLWDAGGTLLRDGIISAGIASPRVGRFRYVDVVDLLLEPGTYTLGAFYPVNPEGGNSRDFLSFNTPGFMTIDEIDYLSGFQTGGGPFAQPTLDLSSLDSIGAANATLDVIARPAIDFDQENPGTANGTLTIGYTFSVTAPLIVTELAVYDAGQDGLADDHEVGIWDEGGMLVVSGTVPSGTPPLGGLFRYVDVDDTALSPGMTYTIGAFYPLSPGGGNTLDFLSYGSGGLETLPELTYGVGQQTGGGAFSQPTIAIGGFDPIGGPSFRAERPLPAVEVSQPQPLGADGTLTLGFDFTVNETVIVTQLGFFDANQDGLQDDHEVGIWDQAGTLLSTATVPADAGPLVGNFRYVNVDNLPLNPGQTYTIGAFFPLAPGGGTLDFLAVQPPSFSTPDEISYVAARQTGGGSFAKPEIDLSQLDPLVGPTFTLVPEPAAGTSALVSLLVVWQLTRRRRRA